MMVWDHGLDERRPAVAENPIRRPMTTVLDSSVRAATWLHGADQYAAGISLARMIAGQIDDVVETSGAVVDPEILKQMHMRMVPNFQKALHALGLTPEGYARMTGVGSPSGQVPTSAASGTTGVATPFDAAAATEHDALDALIMAEDERSNVVALNDRRP